MEMTLNNGFCEMTEDEMELVDGGMLPAAIYALGFAMGMTPAGALAVCGCCLVAGVVVACVCG